MVISGQTTGVEEKLQAAEAALQGAELDDTTEILSDKWPPSGRRWRSPSTKVASMLAQSRRALEYLHPGDLSSRVTAYWVIGFAYTLQRASCAKLARPIPKLLLSAGIREYLWHHPGNHWPRSGAGSRQPARSGSPDLPARPATGWRSATSDYL